MKKTEEYEAANVGSSLPTCTGSGKKRRIQNCTFCKNHGIEAPKKSHLCPHKNCECSLCDLQRKAQLTMKHQQRVWRHQKHKLLTFGGKFCDVTNMIAEKGQVCDKCRNHNKIVMKKNHQCPYSKCPCNYCSLTFKRRKLMKHLQRVRRSNITSSGIVEQTGITTQGNMHAGDDEDSVKVNVDSPEAITVTTSSEDQICASWEGESWRRQGQDPNSMPLEGVIYREEDASTSSSSSSSSSYFSPFLPIMSPSRGPSPPPLIPFPQVHRSSSLYPYAPKIVVSQDLGHRPPQDYRYRVRRTGDLERQAGSPPSLCHIYPEDEGMMSPPLRISQPVEVYREYHQLSPASSSTSSMSHCHFALPSSASHSVGYRSSSHQYLRRYLKFGVEPEDFYLRQSEWSTPTSAEEAPTITEAGRMSHSTLIASPSHCQRHRNPCERALALRMYNHPTNELKARFREFNPHDRCAAQDYPQNLSACKHINQGCSSSLG